MLQLSTTKSDILNGGMGIFLEFRDTLNLLILRVGSGKIQEREMIRPSEI